MEYKTVYVHQDDVAAFQVNEGIKAVGGLAGAAVGLIGTINEQKRLKNELECKTKEEARLQKKLAEAKRAKQEAEEKKEKEVQDKKKELQDRRRELQNEKIHIAELSRTYYYKRYQVKKKLIAEVYEVAKEQNRVEDCDPDNILPCFVEYINSETIKNVNEKGINYFQGQEQGQEQAQELAQEFFFSIFTPQEIAEGYPSNETFSWASEEQVRNILWSLIPCYGKRIILFDKNLKYLDKEQVDKLTTEQIQAIKNAVINLPQDSPIFQKINESSKNTNKRSKKITQNEKEVPPMGKSECCLLI